MNLLQDSPESSPRILSPRRRGEWEPLADGVWKPSRTEEHVDPAVRIARTLFDQPRWLETSLLYDERGTHLFDSICRLPEYYLTRTEDALLAEHSAAIAELAPVRNVVELGAGLARKTKNLLSEVVRRRKKPLYCPVDVSRTALRETRLLMAERFPEVEYEGLCARYEEGLEGLSSDLPKLVVFLGSSIGNFTRPELNHFLEVLTQSIDKYDFLLIGIDRIKSPEILEAAYDDSEGVTAEFILNVLDHVNRLAGTNFSRRKSRYHRLYSPVRRQMEMYVVAEERQRIEFRGLGLHLDWKEDEPILVEISRKFHPDDFIRMLHCYGMELVSHFSDERKWFSLLLFRRR